MFRKSTTNDAVAANELQSARCHPVCIESLGSKLVLDML